MKDKPFRIRKHIVKDACRAVRENKGAPGCDGTDFAAFECKERMNLYRIWNRMSSGSYFPSPVLAVQILKKNGKMRTLGIPTIEDRVAHGRAASEQYVNAGTNSVFHTYKVI